MARMSWWIMGMAVTATAVGDASAQQQAARNQTGPIEVGQDRLVSSGLDDRPVVEPWLAIHPEDSSRFLAAAMVAALPLPPEGESLAPESICATWVSSDSGESWDRHDQPVPGCADPWAAITPEGTGLFTALGEEGTFVSRSPDGGAGWDQPRVPMGDGHDHPVLGAAGRCDPGTVATALPSPSSSPTPATVGAGGP